MKYKKTTKREETVEEDIVDDVKDVTPVPATKVIDVTDKSDGVSDRIRDEKVKTKY